jgi:hypothetical protein
MYGLSSSRAFICSSVLTIFEQLLRKRAVARRSTPRNKARVLANKITSLWKLRFGVPRQHPQKIAPAGHFGSACAASGLGPRTATCLWRADTLVSSMHLILPYKRPIYCTPDTTLLTRSNTADVACCIWGLEGLWRSWWGALGLVRGHHGPRRHVGVCGKRYASYTAMYCLYTVPL